MERRRGPVVDGTGRFLATLAIMFGLGGGLFLYQENQTLKEQIVALQQADASPVDLQSLREEAKDFNARWGTQLEGAVGEAKRRVDEVVRLAVEERDKRDGEIKRIVGQLSKDRVDVARSNELLAELRSFVYAPNLRPVETRMRVGSGVDKNFALVKNEGLIPAEIQSVAFFPRPNGQFQTTAAETSATAARMTDGESLVIRFTKDDNRSDSKDQGLHLSYHRAFGKSEKVIQGDETVPVAILIHNHDHRGWGWEGELEISYGNGERVLVPSVRAVFVADANASVRDI